MKNIDDFCSKRAVSANMKEAFIAYVRSDYARKYSLKSDGETSKLIVGKMNEEDLQEAWKEFVLEMAKYIESRV
jgi:hypothetical protein